MSGALDGPVVGVDGSAHGRAVLDRELDAQVHDTATRSVPVTTRAVADRPARALLEAGGGAELVVLGHRTNDGPRPTRLGSTACAVLAAAPCPVLVVGPTAGGAGHDPRRAVQLDEPIGHGAG